MSADQMPAPVRFTDALAWWFKLGCISFGGPAGQIAIMHSELVEKRRWISERRFLHALNYCMILPGPEAQQLATYIGWLMHGAKGGIAAGALFVLPSLVLMMGLSWAYLALGAHTAADVLYGVKPAVVAVILFAAYRLGRKVLKQRTLWLISILAFAAVFVFKLPFPYLVLAAALFGWLFRHQLKAGDAHMTAKFGLPRSALIDDQTPAPAHARLSWRRFLAFAVVGIGLWAIVLLSLQLGLGSGHVLTGMGRFFTKAALVTFGGAYAVMPYVFQNAVQTYAWLTPAQMMDGLALGETTPGPLIMVVAFIGFVGAWTNPVLSGASAAGLAGGVAGACVATFFTFLPSFLFILLGAPLVEHTREDFRLAGPMTAISAAVVGSILALAAFFALHVFWPQGFSVETAGSLAGGTDWFALTLAAAAGWMLSRGWLGITPLITLCALAGAGWRMLF
jgi:chromate transporter